MSLKDESLLAVCCICSSFCFTRSMAAIIVGFVVSTSQMNWRERVPQFLGRDSQQEGGIAGQADGGMQHIGADENALPSVKLPAALLSLDGQFAAEDINQFQRVMPVHRDVAARDFCVLVVRVTGNVQLEVFMGVMALVIHAGGFLSGEMPLFICLISDFGAKSALPPL